MEEELLFMLHASLIRKSSGSKKEATKQGSYETPKKIQLLISQSNIVPKWSSNPLISARIRRAEMLEGRIRSNRERAAR